MLSFLLLDVKAVLACPMKPNISTLFDFKVLKIHRLALRDNRIMPIRECRTAVQAIPIKGYLSVRRISTWERTFGTENVYFIHVRITDIRKKWWKIIHLWPIRDNFITIALCALCVMYNYYIQHNLAPTKPFSTWQFFPFSRVSCNAVISLVSRIEERKLPFHMALKGNHETEFRSLVTPSHVTASMMLLSRGGGGGGVLT